jgi:uncharacterized membrane protein YheB (UPF0754 family)
MSLADIKSELVEKIIQTNNKDIINHIRAIFDTQQEDTWFESLPEDVRLSVEQGIKEADNGKGRSHIAVMNDLKKWLGK